MLKWGRRVAAALAVLVMGLLVVRGGQAPVRPAAVAGVVDLRSWRFAQQGTVTLSGEWQFYWQQLLEPANLVEGEEGEGVTVPGRWGDHPGDGYGTYRLRVRVQDRTPLAIDIDEITTAYRLWVDGVLAAQVGTVGTSRQAMHPQVRPQTVYVVPQGESIELLLQVSNYRHRVGGIRSPLTMGTPDQIGALRERRAATTMAMASGIAMMAIYHLVLFVLYRRDWAALYFGLLAFIMTIRILAQTEWVAPDFPWEARVRIEYMMGYLGLPALAMFVRALFPDELPRFVAKGLLLATGTLALLALLLPVRLSSELIPAYEPALAAALCYILFALCMATVRGRADAGLFLAGCGIFGITIWHDLLVYRHVLHTPRLLPAGLLALVLAQSLVLARHFAGAFYRQRVLAQENARLLAEATDHLQEIQLTRRMMTTREEHLRKEVAEMLHGRVQTRLLIAASQLDQALELWASDPVRARELTRAGVATIDTTREEEIRSVSHRLHPSVIQVGLVPAVRSLIRQYDDLLDVTLTVDPAVTALDDSIALAIPELHRLAVYRVLEEALANICAHAEATHAEIALGLSGEGALTLRVSDDGSGFEPSQVSYGLGLRSIAARVHDLGGQWEITGRPGLGTLLTLSLPLTEAQPPLSRSASL